MEYRTELGRSWVGRCTHEAGGRTDDAPLAHSLLTFRIIQERGILS